MFVEVGPKRALQGFASDVLGDDAVLSLATNHPKQGDIASFNSALCGLWAAGLGAGIEEETAQGAVLRGGATAQPRATTTAAQARAASPAGAVGPRAGSGLDEATYNELGRLFAEFLERGRELIGGRDEEARPTGEPVVITGAAIGLPGAERLFDDANVARMLDGEQGIDVIPARLRQEILDKHITRLVKDEGGGSFETIDSLGDVIKLAARAGAFDLEEEFGIDADRLPALGRDTQLAIAAGIDALRDAGIPLVRRLQDHDYRHPPSRELVAARADARRHRCDLRLGVPRPGGDGRRGDPRSRRPHAQGASLRARVAARPHARSRGNRRGRPRGGRAPYPRRPPPARGGALRLRSPLHLPRALDGALAARGDDQGPRAQHPDQLGVREHHPGRGARRGLDPRGPLPAGR